MQSSPLPASSAPETQENGQEELSWIKLMTLAKEEHVDGEQQPETTISMVPFSHT